jgi:hypothetical protein
MDCSIDYRGRLSAHLPLARRIIMVKADGTVAVHADSGSKALNWMSPPCQIAETPDRWVVTGPKGEVLEINIVAVHDDLVHVLGDEPGLQKHGAESELQALLAAHPDTIEPGLALIRREWPTELGPVDLLCRDDAGVTTAVEIKRVGEIDGVEQLTRYLEWLNRDPLLKPVRGAYVATRITPQARALASARGIKCVEIDLETLSGRAVPAMTLF